MFYLNKVYIEIKPVSLDYRVVFYKYFASNYFHFDINDLGF